MRTPRKAAAILLIATALFAVATPAIAKPPARNNNSGGGTPTTSYGTYRLDWAASADMAGAQPLDGATVTAKPAWVRMAVVSNPTVTISVVKWYVNGALVRDTDVDPTYDLWFDGYSFPETKNGVSAFVNFSDGTVQQVQAMFTQRTSSTTSTTAAPSTTSTTAAPSTTSTTAAPTTTTAPSTTTTTAPNGSLPFPGPGTVGHLANLPGYNTPATNLTTYNGNFNSSYDGQVIDAMNVTGWVIVNNRNVVIKRSRIGLGVISIPSSSHPSVSARVEWSTIGPEYGYEGTHVSGNGEGENLTFYRNEIFGGVDNFNFYYSGNVTIQENWVYGAYQMLDDPYQSSPTLSHNDGIQVHKGGAHYHVIGNRFDLFLFRGYYWSGTPNQSSQIQYSPRHTAKDDIGVVPNVSPMTTGFLFQQTNGPLDDIVFDGNRVDGDFYRALSFEKGPYSQSATNVRITNNTFVRRYSTFGRNQLVGADTYSNILWQNNKDEKGTTIAPVSGMKTY